MQKELNELETKVAQVVTFCRTLQEENADLRRKLTAMDDDKKRMSARMEAARTRLAQLAEQLPVEEDEEELSEGQE